MIKKILLAVGLLASAPAMATPTTLTLTNFGGAHGTYIGMFNEAVSTGAFTQTFTFQLPSPLYNIGASLLTSTGTDLKSGSILLGSTGIGLTNFAINNVSGSINVLPGTTNNFGGLSLVSAETVASFSSPSAVRGGWTNYITVSGVSGGANSFDLVLNATYAVPEPKAWAMMIGGFALIGGMVMLRRRRETATLAAA